MATPSLPVLEREVKTEPTTTPDFQAAFQAYGESANTLGAIGARVAQSASNQMATQLGYEQGKNPHGDLSPSITEFDKNFAASYHAQADATLTLQGQKLIDDAHVEMSKPARLTPQLIDKTHQQIQLGLNKIAENAPTAIKGKIQATFDSQLLQQTNQFKEKMISQQREDQRNTIINALDVNTKNALEFATNGDLKAADQLVKSSQQMAQSAVNSRFLTPEQARVAHESVEQAALNGKYTNLALEAQRNNKLAEFEKNYATNKPSEMDNEQWHATGQAFVQQVGFLDNLKKQDESIRVAKFNLAIAESPNNINGQMIADLQANVSPQEFINAQIRLVNAKNKASKSNSGAVNLSANITDNNTFAGATQKEKNDAFDLSVGNYIQESANRGQTLPLADAQLHVAMSAAGTIPKYVNLLKEQLSGTNPQDISIAGQSVERMYQSGNAQKLNGLGDEAKAMFEKFQALRTSMPDFDAAQKAHEIVYGKTPEQKKANDEAWKDNIKKKISTSESQEHFFLTQAGVSPGSIVRNSTAYAGQMRNTYESYFKLLNGDDTTARKMLQKNVDLTYGETSINGEKEFTYLPIEKMLNLPDNAAGVIQSDVATQLTEQFQHTKTLYDAGRSDFYWEVRPKTSVQDVHDEIKKVKEKGYSSHSLMANEKLNQFNNKNGVEVIRHWRGNQIEKYETVLQANPYSTVTTDQNNPVSGGWEIMLKSDKGVKSISLLDPIASVVTYRPNLEKIKNDYATLNLKMGK